MEDRRTYSERIAEARTRMSSNGRRRTRSPQGQMKASPRAYEACRKVGMLVTSSSAWRLSVGGSLSEREEDRQVTSNLSARTMRIG